MEPFERELEVPAPRGVSGTAAYGMLSVFVMIAALRACGDGGAVTLLCGLLFALPFGVRALRDPEANAKSVRVRIDEYGLCIDGKRVASRDELSRAELVQQGLDVIVEMAGRRFCASSLDEGRALLEAAGARERVRFMARSPLGARVGAWTLPLLFLIAIAALFLISKLAALVAFVPLLIVAAQPTWVRLGDDGVRVSWLGRTRLVAYGSIAGVTEERERAVIATTSGKRVVLAQRGEGPGATRVRELVEERLARHARGREMADLFARRDQSIEAWVERARALGGNGGDYRGPAIPVDELRRVVDDASADPTARAGAAIALGDSLDDAAQRRVRVALEDADEAEAFAGARACLQRRPPENVTSDRTRRRSC